MWWLQQKTKVRFLVDYFELLSRFSNPGNTGDAQYSINSGFTGGFLIAAGTKAGNNLLPTEKLNPFSNKSCPSGDIKRARKFASFCNNLLCGGDPTFRSCEKFDGISTFEELPVSLVEKRKNHLCWGLQSGEVLLLGGEHSWSNTELVSADGKSSSANFTLPYETG